jgi:hypothetical protein
MSEYQYYEFLAIDHPLTERQMDSVRQFSSRAKITSTRFINEYNYGDFRGDPEDFLKRFFDVMVYVANWGTRRIMFRVPKSLVDIPLAKSYCGDESLEVTSAGEYVMFNITAQEEGGDWEEGEGWMASLVPLRAEVMAGDMRPLYLAWLAGVQVGAVEDDTPEPSVPPGLDKLTPAQKKLVKFLRIDKAILKVAAEVNVPNTDQPEELAQWISSLSNVEKDQLLLNVMRGDDPNVGAKLLRRFQLGRRSSNPPKQVYPSRLAGDLRKQADW